MNKFWVWTLNHPKELPEEIIACFKDKCDYVIFQKEKGENGTEHYQGYVELARSQRLSFLKKILPRAHFERRRGTRQQAREYCQKEESRIEGPWEYGEFKEKKPGQRNDLSALRDMVLERKTPRKEIINMCSNNQQLRFVENLTKYQTLSSEYHKKRVTWCYGKTGSGKTRFVMSKVAGKDYFMADTAKWMDGYYGQEFVVIDELRPKDWPYARMLKLLDGYEILTPIKGGYVIWNPKRIYITSPYRPEDTYYMTASIEGGIEQLLRRITNIKLFGDENRRDIVQCVTPSIYREFNIQEFN